MKRLILLIFILATYFGIQAQNSLYFDGGDAATVPSANLLGNSAGAPFTIEVWVYKNNSQNQNTIFCSASNYDDFPYMGINNNTKIQFYYSGNNVESDDNITLNKWEHIAVSYDGSNLRMYLNGNLTKTHAASNLNFGGPTYYYWGWSSGNTQWSGWMDEMIIWNTARTQSEIRSDLVKESLTGGETGLVLYYNLNEGSGQTLNNQVSGGPDGVLGDTQSVEADDPTWALGVEPVTTGPGGVLFSKLWMDAGNGTTNSGGNLTAWSDLSEINTFTVNGTPTHASNQINFNPVVSFDKGSDGNTGIPTNRLDGNTQITFKEGFSVATFDADWTTLIGSTVSGTNHGLCVFDVDKVASDTYISAESGISLLYKAFKLTGTTIQGYHLLNLDVDGTPGTGEIDNTSYPLNSGQGTFTSLNITPMIGGTNNTAGSGAYPFHGSVAEMVLFSESLSADEKQRVTSYLAIKYGIHIPGNYTTGSGTIWDATANSTYHNDVFGIGKDITSQLNQTQSNSINTGSGDGTGQSGEGNIVITNPTSLDNGDFLLIGHNLNSLGYLYTGSVPPDAPSCLKRRVRDWKVSRTGDPGNVDIDFDITGLSFPSTAPSDAQDCYILIDADGDGDYSDGTAIAASQFAGNIASFDGLDNTKLADGAVFTFGFVSPGLLTWDGSEGTVWASAGNWDEGIVPCDVDNVVIPDVTNDPIIPVDGQVTVNNLTVNSGGSLTISSDATGTGSLIVNGTASGDVTVQRFLTHDKWHYISGQTNISGNFSTLSMGLTGGTNNDQFYRWDEALETSGTPGTWVDILNGNGSGTLMGSEGFVACKGYAINYITTDKTLSLSGVPYTSNQSINITKTSGSTNEGANLVGNPFTSTIAANSNADATNNFISTNSSLLDDNANVIYLWDEKDNYTGNRDDYETVSNSSGATYIAPGQGFMVIKKDATSVSIAFNTNMRKHGSATFYKTAASDDVARFYMSVESQDGELYNEILIAFIEGMTKGLDISYDAGKLKGNPDIALYTRLVEDNGHDFAHQALPLLDDEAVAVKTGLDVTSEGSYKFKIQELQNFDDFTEIKLQDKQTNTIVDLREDGEYSFFVSSHGEIRDRFVLHFNGVTGIEDNLQITEPNIQIYSSNNNIYILNPQKQKGTATIFNITGQDISSFKLTGNAKQQYPLIHAGNIILIVKVQTATDVISKKVILN